MTIRKGYFTAFNMTEGFFPSSCLSCHPERSEGSFLGFSTGCLAYAQHDGPQRPKENTPSRLAWGVLHISDRGKAGGKRKSHIKKASPLLRCQKTDIQVSRELAARTRDSFSLEMRVNTLFTRSFCKNKIVFPPILLKSKSLVYMKRLFSFFLGDIFLPRETYEK